MTPVLKERLDKAAEVYQKRPGIKFILSGCQGDATSGSDVDLMYAYLREHIGIVPAQLIKDYDGKNTLASFKSLQKKVPAVEIMIITNNFHLPRAVYIALKLQFIPYGVFIEELAEDDREFFKDREIAAGYKAWFNLHS